jgi:hypothetical protein
MGARTGIIILRQCSSKDDLPRGSVPLLSPKGVRQTIREGRRHAFTGLLFFLLIILACLALGLVLIAKGSIILVLVAAFLAWKIRPGVRLLRNQRGWPLEDCRVDRHGDELDEWQRWATTK